jgi:adenylate cyclase
VVPYEQVYEGAVDDPFYRGRGFFRDKIVLIGDTTTIGNDHRITPVGDMWSVEIHAHAIATLLQRWFIHDLPRWLNLVVLALLAGLVCPVAALCPPRRAAVGVVGLVAGYALANAWLFVDRGVWLHLVGPAAAMLMVATGVLVERGLTDEREKARMRGMLRRYLSPQTAEYVMASPEACVLGGRRVTATVMFADVRDFTPLAGELAPEEVVGRLNEIFQALTEVVFRYEGTVDKYIGDCVMAVFGAPVPYLDHARRAVAAALDMQAEVAQMQARWRSQGLRVLELGIGINTGEMVVGNIGSQQRLDFTVIGDAVNLAQRVEALNRDLGTGILITEAVVEALGGRVRVGGRFTAAVQGRQDEVTVYEVLGLAPAEPERAS